MYIIILVVISCCIYYIINHRCIKNITTRRLLRASTAKEPKQNNYLFDRLCIVYRFDSKKPKGIIYYKCGIMICTMLYSVYLP